MHYTVLHQGSSLPSEGKARCNNRACLAYDARPMNCGLELTWSLGKTMRTLRLHSIKHRLKERNRKSWPPMALEALRMPAARRYLLTLLKAGFMNLDVEFRCAVGILSREYIMGEVTDLRWAVSSQ